MPLPPLKVNKHMFATLTGKSTKYNDMSTFSQIQHDNFFGSATSDILYNIKTSNVFSNLITMETIKFQRYTPMS
jgi:hypothetical protein